MYYVLGKSKKERKYRIYEITTSKRKAVISVSSLMEFDKVVSLIEMEYKILETDDGEFFDDNFQSFDAVNNKDIVFQTSIFKKKRSENTWQLYVTKRAKF